MKLIHLVPASIVGLFCTVVAYRAADGVCGNSAAREYIAPDYATKVVVFTRDCGATTDFSTHASVLPASASLPNDSGNAFAADSSHDLTVSGVGLAVTWRDGRTVELSHHANARVFKAASSVNGINVVHTTWR